MKIPLRESGEFTLGRLFSLGGDRKVISCVPTLGCCTLSLFSSLCPWWLHVTCRGTPGSRPWCRRYLSSHLVLMLFSTPPGWLQYISCEFLLVSCACAFSLRLTFLSLGFCLQCMRSPPPEACPDAVHRRSHSPPPEASRGTWHLDASPPERSQRQLALLSPARDGHSQSCTRFGRSPGHRGSPPGAGHAAGGSSLALSLASA